jgi:crotonobetainyl-CoA:carnitine CoA-transferase CaiB-like acyl-CoA transferase
VETVSTMTNVAQRGPLDGVRIIDLTSVVFGPYATQLLGDLGADVVKVEGPKRGEKGEGGDTMRYAGVASRDFGPGDLGPIFMNLNRNKRSVFVDLGSPAGRETLAELIRGADVFVSNVRMNALKRLGLSYEEVAAINPGIVYAHGSGYDSDGPDADLPAYDDLIQARSGMADLLSRAGGGSEPRYLPALIADKVSGLFLSQAILAALYHRKVTGEGQAIEVPMMECATSFTLIEHLFGHTFDPPQGQWGYQRVLSEHRRPYRTLDGHISMLPYSTEQWDAIFSFVGRPGQILDDERFATFTARTANIDLLYEMLGEVMAARTTADWLERLTELDVPHVKVNRLEQVQADSQLTGVDFFQQMTHPTAGSYVAMRPPVKFSKTPATMRLHPPTFGEHTEEVLGALKPSADGKSAPAAAE